jgi:hypothetical protein
MHGERIKIIKKLCSQQLVFGPYSLQRFISGTVNGQKNNFTLHTVPCSTSITVHIKTTKHVYTNPLPAAGLKHPFSFANCGVWFHAFSS